MSQIRAQVTEYTGNYGPISYPIQNYSPPPVQQPQNVIDMQSATVSRDFLKPDAAPEEEDLPQFDGNSPSSRTTVT